MASWTEDSGSLPPPFHWQVHVEFLADQSGNVIWCKGYADGPPGCASTSFTITPEDLARLKAAIKAGEFDRAPQQEDDVPVGGGSTSGVVVRGDQTQRVVLPAYPVKADQDRVAALIALMKEITPADALAKVEAQAESPGE